MLIFTIKDTLLFVNLSFLSFFRLFTALDLSYNVIKDNFFCRLQKGVLYGSKITLPAQESVPGNLRGNHPPDPDDRGLRKGKNEHFRTAADFMKYFESLYPASDALTKQVQRAIRSLNMPKDELGYFIPNKTAEQLAHEQELTYILKRQMPTSAGWMITSLCF